MTLNRILNGILKKRLPHKCFLSQINVFIPISSTRSEHNNYSRERIGRGRAESALPLTKRKCHFLPSFPPREECDEFVGADKLRTGRSKDLSMELRYFFRIRFASSLVKSEKTKSEREGEKRRTRLRVRANRATDVERTKMLLRTHCGEISSLRRIPPPRSRSCDKTSL